MESGNVLPYNGSGPGYWGPAVQVRMQRLGLISTDLLGGITLAQAARESGSLATLQHAIRLDRLQARKVGRLWVIPHATWESWKATIVGAPEGYVQLSTVRERLRIRSDKLSEFARLGYIPTAIRCKPHGTSIRTTKEGTWFVTRAEADKLLADRSAGAPMPWQGKPLMDNLKATWRLLEERRHPAECETCDAHPREDDAAAALTIHRHFFHHLQEITNFMAR